MYDMYKYYCVCNDFYIVISNEVNSVPPKNFKFLYFIINDFLLLYWHLIITLDRSVLIMLFLSDVFKDIEPRIVSIYVLVYLP